MKRVLQVAKAVGDAVGRMVPFEVRGVDAKGGDLPFVEVAARGPMRVLYYAPRGERRLKTPIVFAYSLINRYYILDFMPGRSLLETLTERGHPCYVIDWGAATAADRHKTWQDYALGYVGLAVRTACEREGVDQVHLYGYCMGGTMALAYAALRPERVKTFVAMAVPVDFHDDGILSRWTRPEFFNVDAVVDAFGNVPTWLMESGFRFLAPIGNVTKWRDVWKNRDDDDFLQTWRRLEKWSSDNVPFPGEVYRQYIRDTYQTNAFVRGEMHVGGERVDLGAIEVPVLMVLAERDHIVPEPSAMALRDVVGSDEVEVLRYRTGHIGLSTSSRAPTTFWPPISDWLAAHD
ncbi:MAG: alpha/beta fold hydrolase [Myxococcales bacterium]|nr:alpha/beta fold hydrolase [Myxococcales bacterium]